MIAGGPPPRTGLASAPPPVTIPRALPSPFRIHLALLTVSLVFGANYVFTKRILATVPPGAWVAFRIVAATVVLVPLALLLARRRHWPDRRRLAGLAIASFFGVVLNQVLFTEGMARTTPEHSAVVNACIPTWTLLAAALAGQERLTGRRLFAIGLALGGVWYLLGFDLLLWGPGSGPGHDAGTSLFGDLLTMLNGWSFAVHLVLMRRLGRDLDPWRSTAVMFLVASAAVGSWYGPTIGAAEVTAVTRWPVLLYAGYAVLFATVLTYLLNTWALRHTRSSQVALYINVQPLVAALLHWALGAPVPDHRFFVALALVAAGLWLQNRNPGA